MRYCTVPTDSTDDRGKVVPCGKVAFRIVGAKGFCGSHIAEAYAACRKGGKYVREDEGNQQHGDSASGG